MTKITKRILFALACTASMLGAPAVFAGGTGNVTVTQLTVYMAASATYALIEFTPANPSGLSGCTYTTGNYVMIDFTATGNPNGRDLYVSVLAAEMAGAQINIGTSGCGANGYYPVAYGINVFP